MKRVIFFILTSFVFQTSILYGYNCMKEMKELLNKCVWTWSSGGYTVTGPNGKAIFFPVTYYNSLNNWYVAEYWSSTNKKPGVTVGGVYSISLNSEVMGKYNEYVGVPYSGKYIRPVATK